MRESSGMLTVTYLLSWMLVTWRYTYLVVTLDLCNLLHVCYTSVKCCIKERPIEKFTVNFKNRKSSLRRRHTFVKAFQG